ELCWLSWRLGEETTEDHALQAHDISGRIDQSQSELAEAFAWLALAARLRGDELSARRWQRQAGSLTRRLRIFPGSRYYDALAAYHERGGEPERALAAREEELAG